MSARVERSVLRLSIPLKEPFVTSAGVVSARELLLLRLEARDGTVGYGEAAPFEPYDGVPLERAVAALTGGAGRRRRARPRRLRGSTSTRGRRSARSPSRARTRWP